MMYCTRLIILSAHDARSTLISPQILILEEEVTKKKTIRFNIKFNCVLTMAIFRNKYENIKYALI